jgi:hypothetical protein
MSFQAPAIGLSWRDSFKKSFKKSKNSSDKRKGLTQKKPTSAKVFPAEPTPVVNYEEPKDEMSKFGAHDGKNGAEIDKWGTMVGSFGFEQLDIKDYEYRQCAHFLNSMKADPRSDKILVSDVSKALITYKVLKTEVEGVGLCRRINKTEGGPKEISIGDFMNAAQFNRKHDGDTCRKFIRAINSREINRVLGVDTIDSTPPLSIAGNESEPEENVVKKTTSKLRRLYSRLSSKNLDELAPAHVEPNPAPPAKSKLAKRSIKLRVIVKLFGFGKKSEKKKDGFEHRSFGIKNVHNGFNNDDEDSSYRHHSVNAGGYHKEAAKKVGALTVVHSRDYSSDEQLSDRAKREIEEYMSQFADIEDQG